MKKKRDLNECTYLLVFALLLTPFPSHIKARGHMQTQVSSIQRGAVVNRMKRKIVPSETEECSKSEMIKVDQLFQRSVTNLITRLMTFDIMKCRLLQIVLKSRVDYRRIPCGTDTRSNADVSPFTPVELHPYYCNIHYELTIKWEKNK